jgi:hypothetical protein
MVLITCCHQSTAGGLTCACGVHADVLIQAENIGSCANKLVIAATFARIGHGAPHQLARVLNQHVALCMWLLCERAPAVYGALACRQYF